MWVEIGQTEGKVANDPPANISPPPDQEFELRLVVWKTKDIEEMNWEGCSDIYVRAFINPDYDKVTDTHWRCQTGEGSFGLVQLENAFQSEEQQAQLHSDDPRLGQGHHLL